MKSDNNYGLPAQVMRPVHIYSVFHPWGLLQPSWLQWSTTHHVLPFMSRLPRDNLPFYEGVCRCLTFDETPPPTPEFNSNDEYLPTADMDDPVQSDQPVPDSWEYLCIHKYPDQQLHPHNPIKWKCPRAWTHGIRHCRVHTRPYRHSCWRNTIRLWCMGTQCTTLSVVVWHFMNIWHLKFWKLMSNICTAIFLLFLNKLKS